MRYILIAILFSSISCLKDLKTNERALLQQKSCIESIEHKDYGRAKNHCELCLEFDRHMVECLNGLGLIYLIEKDEEKAKHFFSQAIRQNNDYSQARSNLGVIYFSKGNFHQALDFFNRALEIDPSNLDARYNAGLSHFRLAQNSLSPKHLKLAEEHIAKLLALEPQYTGALRDLGFIFIHQAELSRFAKDEKELLEKAQVSLEECLRIEPENDSCHEGIGTIYNKLGRFKEAFGAFYQCLAYGANNTACRFGIIQAYENSIKTEDGFLAFSKIIEETKDSKASLALCLLLFDKGLIREAVEHCTETIKQKPDLCLAHFRLGDHFAMVLDSQKAIKHCQDFLVCDHKGLFIKEQKQCSEIISAIKNG